MAGQVPELLVKKRKRDDAWAAKRAAAALEARKKSREARRDIFKRAEQYVKEYRSQVHQREEGLIYGL
jgi:large subunit ribosomal protein L7e